MRKTPRANPTASATTDSPLFVANGSWHAISERMTDGCLLVDPQSILVDANSHICHLLAYTRDELFGRSIADFISPCDADTEPLFDTAGRLVVCDRLRCMMIRKDNTRSAALLSTVRVTSDETLAVVRSTAEHNATDVSLFRLASIVSNSNDAIIGKDLNGFITDWNHAAEKIFGYAAHEMIGQSIAKILPPDRLHEEDRILQHIRNGQTVDHFETVRRTKQNTLIDVSVTISPIRNAAGTIVGASKIARDITEEKKHERDLTRMSRLYNALSQINQAIVYTKNRDELFAKVCEVLVERGGFKMAWIGLNEPDPHTLTPVATYGDSFNYVKNVNASTDDVPKGRGPSGFSLQTGKPYICQDMLNDPATEPWRDLIKRTGYRASAAFPIRERLENRGTLNVYADQRQFFNDEEISLLSEAAGDVSFALDNFSRETERETAERVAREEMEFSNTIIDRIPGIFCVMDYDGNLLNWNKNLESLSEFSAHELTQMRPAILFEFSTAILSAQRPRGTPRTDNSPSEVQITTKSGARIPCIFTTTHVEYKGSRCLVCIGFDISKRKRAEESLRKLNASLERQVAERTRELRDALDHALAAEEVKSVFLATMSHELRTPLNSIIGFTQILRQGMAGELNAEQSKQLGMIHNSARHLLDLINDVLDISKIEAGQLELHMQSFDLRTLLERAVSFVEPMAKNKGLDLVVNIPPAIDTAFTDERRIEQILLNLLNNAIKFTKSGTIGLSAEIINDYKPIRDAAAIQAVRVHVSDTGIGIRAEELGTLFQPFQQLDTGLARQHEGTGLGLAICRRLVELLHGDITVESQYGNGSTFSCTFPLNASIAS